MVKKTYRRRYPKKKGMSFLKAISNYTYTKLTIVDQIALDSSSIKLVISGDIRYRLYEYLSKCADWDTYKTLYLTFKVVAVKMTCVPNPPEGNFAWRGSGAIAIVSNTDDNGFKATVESNKSLMLSPTQVTRGFFRLNGGATGWENSGSPAQTGGAIQVGSSSGAQSGGLIWSLRLDFYVMFKNTL